MVALCLSSLCVPLLTATVAADDPTVVRVGLYENAPKIFTDDQGIAAGFWPEIVEYIADEEGWVIEYVPGSWSECMRNLADNDIDMMPDVAYTEERATHYAFGTEVVYTSWATVYSHQGTDIQSIVDLEGKTVAVLAGSVNVDGPGGIKELVTAFDIECVFVEVDSYSEVLETVNSGTADAGVTSKDFGYRHKNSYGLSKTPIIFQPSRLHFAFSMDSDRTAYLIESTDHHVRKIKEAGDSIYYQALRTWITGETEEPSIPRWLLISLAGIGGLALILATGAFALRAQVASRTSDLTQEITRRKDAEHELEQSHEHLEELVKQRTRQLEEANLHKLQFLANMSHELRTPLNSIIGYTKLMLDGMDGTITDDQREDLQTVYDNSRHLLSLINDLLDLSKIEAGKFEVVKEDYAVSELISLIVPTMQKLAEDKGLELTCTVAPEIETVYADKNKTKQILFNLLGNAVKFTNKGSIRLDISTTEGDFIFSVTDTGIGISPQDIPHLFESYKQVGPARLDGSEGTGLGLIITKQFVEMQSGRMWVESDLGKGSTFSFTLPTK